MKYRFLALTLILAPLIFLSASPWEGAGAIAPAGELPVSGFFVSTNSFPRNTVVDIQNIETGRSIRVIVANTLDSPGLLAIVSREAAEAIGMRAGSVSRIRMIQPQDPIAYFRFKEGLDAAGSRVITEEDIIASSALNGIPRVNGSDVNREIDSDGTARPYVLDPEWLAGDRVEVVIITEPSSEHTGDQITSEESEETEETEETERYVESPDEVYVAEATTLPSVYEEEEIIDTAITQTPIEEVPVEHLPAEQPPVTEQPRVQEIVESPVPAAEPETPPAGETVPFNIVSAEERPPEHRIYGIDPQNIIPGINIAPNRDPAPSTVVPPFIPEPAPVVTQPPVIVFVPPVQEPEIAETRPVTIPEEHIIDGIPQRVHEEEPDTRMSLREAEEIISQSTIDGIPAPAAPSDDTPIAVIPSVVPVREEEEFSIPRIYSLDRGQYYVQLAALDTVESIENALTGIDRSYRPVVYKDGDEWYRILLGPLNQGESAAVLQRFRSIGFNDAFVRHVR